MRKIYVTGLGVISGDRKGVEKTWILKSRETRYGKITFPHRT